MCYTERSIEEFNAKIDKIKEMNKSNVNIMNPQVYLCEENGNIEPELDEDNLFPLEGGYSSIGNYDSSSSI